MGPTDAFKATAFKLQSVSLHASVRDRLASLVSAMDLMSDVIEAFFEFGGGSEREPLWCSAGYRILGTGEIVCSVKLPFALAEAAIVGRSKISLDLSPGGQIDVSVAGVLANEQLDGLVARAVSETTLGLEEATALDLKALLRRLERSVGLVQEAIARMPTAPKVASIDGASLLKRGIV